MDDPARILEDRVEDLARAIAKTINGAEIPGRPDVRADLRDLAIGVLQDSVVPADPVAVAVVEGADARFNPLGMGIPLFFAGGVLIFLFPPVGMMLFAASAVMIVWGLVTSLLARG
jgi:hypothetical protein